MSIKEWFAAFRQPSLTVPDIMSSAHDVDSIRRRESNIAKAGYHLHRLNDLLSRYHGIRDVTDPERQVLLGAVSRRVTMLKHLGVDLPTDLRRMQTVVSELAPPR